MIRPINFHIMSTTAHNAIEQVEFFQDLRNTCIKWIFFERFPIQNNSDTSTTEKLQSNTKYSTWNSIKLEFVKRTRMPTLLKTFNISRATARVALGLLKALTILLDTSVRRSKVERGELKSY